VFGVLSFKLLLSLCIVKNYLFNIVIEIINGKNKGDSPQPQEIFTAFYTTKSAEEGTGLGLSICNSIIENHEGELTVINNPDKGVTFTVKLLKKGVKSL